MQFTLGAVVFALGLITGATLVVLGTAMENPDVLNFTNKAKDN